MQATNPLLTIARYALLALASLAAFGCLLIFLDFAHSRWPLGPFGGFRAHALFEFAVGFGVVALIGSVLVSNAQRIGRGEGWGRVLAGLAGAAGVVAAFAGLSGCGFIVAPFLEAPVETETLAPVVVLLPFAAQLAALGCAGATAGFAPRPPSVASVIEILLRLMPWATAAAGGLIVLAVARSDDGGKTAWIAGPTGLGLAVLTAALLAGTRGGLGGWALLRAVVGYALGAAASLFVSAVVAEQFGVHDVRAQLLSVIFFAPLTLAALGALGVGALVAAAPPRVAIARVRRALA